MNIEKQKENFKNHVATFTDYGNIKIVDFKAPETSYYRIRFLFEEDYCRLHISGDLGELIATNYNNMTFDKFSDFVNSTGYFEQKINCHSKDIYVYDEDLAKEQLYKILEEYDMLEEIYNHDRYDFETDENKLNEFYENLFEDFTDTKGIGSKGFDVLCEKFEEPWAFADDLGKKETGILELYMLAFKLAKEQLDNQLNHYMKKKNRAKNIFRNCKSYG